MIRSILICIFTLFLSACGNNTTVMSAETNQAIAFSTLNYVKNHSAMPSMKVNVTAIVRSNDYARAYVIPIEPTTDPAHIFLKQTSQGWVVISLGTAFNQAFYKKYQIPKELQL
jgi:hypothetical protein